MFIQAFARCSIFMAEGKRGNIRDLRRHLAVCNPLRTVVLENRDPVGKVPRLFLNVKKNCLILTRHAQAIRITKAIRISLDLSTRPLRLIHFSFHHIPNMLVLRRWRNLSF